MIRTEIGKQNNRPKIAKKKRQVIKQLNVFSNEI